MEALAARLGHGRVLGGRLRREWSVQRGAAVRGGALAGGQDEVLGHLEGLARAAAVQKARDVAAAHLVLRGELRGARGEQLLQVLPCSF